MLIIYPNQKYIQGIRHIADTQKPSELMKYLKQMNLNTNLYLHIDGYVFFFK